MTSSTPELAAPSPNFCAASTGGRSPTENHEPAQDFQRGSSSPAQYMRADGLEKIGLRQPQDVFVGTSLE
ncbi:hypothetical protein AVEN_106223-1 [Araneus ventricosus]|uniref:Uncharacterized protein n=1 Tax=Araneus ventricosus TaxID=182803 RepID=A0A4Y2I551_ARAVE|nr:hypothetical protein AVEN_106223-1 [Araneus ventricosus]